MAAQLSNEVIQSVIDSRSNDVFSVLGMHELEDGGYCVRAYVPGIKNIELWTYDGLEMLAPMECLHANGLYEGVLPGKNPDKYLLKIYGDWGEQLIEDCYRFASLIDEQDTYLFAEGNNEKAYEFLGAHLMTVDGVDGCRFAVWAPNASRVSVVGDFNMWDGRRHVMRKLVPSGIWEIFIPEITEGEKYKFELKDSHGNLLPHKADPYGFAAEQPPQQASVVVDQNAYEWGDAQWQDQRGWRTKIDSAISVYEVHLGSWKRVPEEGNRYLSYRELAAQLIPYVKAMGFTHIQLMPVSEYPFDGSWGYQPVGLFAATSRYGSIDDFKYFVDQCHQSELAVLIDWVPGHFPTDAHGLGRFDGTPLYEHADHRQGFHPDWNTYIYNYGRSEVSGFLMSNALFWLDKYHIDGLRVDAVASMLYLDYSREDGEWVANRFGGRENLEAIDFLKNTNERVYKNFPDTMMVAEESTAWPGVSKPIYAGGLGFGFKWNMGWMNDSLEYMSKEPIHRKFHHHNMTFSLLYAFSENFVLPLSHDEVVHGKGSILDRMPGDGWQKFANLRAYYAFMWTHPGKKLMFMGCEFGQGPEWDHDGSLCWHQLDLKEHQGVQNLIRDLNHLYVASPALYDNDCEPEGFEWVEADDRHNSVFAFLRKSIKGNGSQVVITNMTPVPREDYRVGVDLAGNYREKLNTDADIYGGSNMGNAGVVESIEQSWQGRERSIVVTVPPLATVIFEYEAD
ncbi:1,4-alpha-glucan branching protein GlgB [Agaribacterium sp. ZY112]|uniref:1,4-alpha-glucan branching protein GlgB n=1 Tax=Agaribacterium sp. ZY112 TaxID=3233574 RepID=UPI0035240BE0